jgi:hypothetical protein
MLTHQVGAAIASIAAVLVMIGAQAAVPNLEEYETQCRDEIMATQCPVGNCYQLWKPIMRCTFATAFGNQVNMQALDACINRVTDERQVHNLVLNEVYSCVLGE